jgi:cytosine/adenosine deaminase-related metal-dependent hydrolase
MVSILSPFARLPAALALVALVAAPSGVANAAPAGPVTVIRNVNLVTMDQAPAPGDMAIVIRGGKIQALVPAGRPLPKGATMIDGGGGWVIPGLIDAHVHYPYYGFSKPANYLRYGVTTVFSLGTPEPLDDLLRDREAISRGELAGPHIYATGPSIANQVKLETVDQVEPFLASLQARGLEFVKIYNEIPQPVFDAVVAGAHRRKMGVFGHMPRRFPPEYTLTHGLDVLAHMEELFFTVFEGPRDRDLAALTPDWTPDYSRIDPVLDLIARNKVAVIPNLSASLNFQNLWTDEEREFSTSDMQYLKPELLRLWREGNFARRDQVDRRVLREQVKFPLIRTLTYRASKKGILLLAGSDAPLPALFPGRSLHQELRLMVAAGLTAEQSLRTATANGGIAVARYVDRSACIGVIKVDCEADLVLLRADPLEDIRNAAAIAGVMTDGRWYTPEQLDQLSRP